METNILKALVNFAKKPVVNIVENYNSSSNRVNSEGEALEIFVKDIFSDSLHINEFNEKQKNYSKVFSYLGSKNSPPDLMIESGDALEVKKLASVAPNLALNSSSPKDKLYIDDPRLNAACKQCESWIEKDFIYTVGVVRNRKLHALWFVYGDCFAADRSVYDRIRNSIGDGVTNLPDIVFSKTKELGRVNGVDPLGITDLRIRGMWHIKNPMKLFSEFEDVNTKENLSVIAMMKTDKYMSFSLEDRKELEGMSSDFLVSDEKIQSPNNPAELLDIKLIKYIR